jgi:two-component system, chemotaxis family, response regulator Rcp1
MSDSSLSGFQILLVEDSPSDAALLIRYLQKEVESLNLHWVMDGETALNILQQSTAPADGASVNVTQVHLLILDLNLPGLHGREVFAALRSDADLCHLPTVILTTSSYDLDVLPSPPQSQYCYMVKPSNLSEYAVVAQKIVDFWRSNLL